MRVWLPHLKRRLDDTLSLTQVRQASPPLVLAVSFLLLILLGSLLLWLPVASHRGLSYWQALFTACSAVTVTGLSVVDLGSHMTLFGQAVVMGLIQLGGLGLMTFAGLSVIALGGQLGLRGQKLVREALDQTAPGDILVMVRHVAMLAFVLEALGACALATVWVPQLGWGRGLWFSLFHSVSAFNNAGFGLLPDSLTRWAGSPVVNLVITALLIIGGLGFTVLMDLWRRRGFARLSLHSKLTLSGTVILALGAWGLIMLFEWHNADTLAALAPADRPWAAWFAAVTPRTAGFNTIDVAGLSAPSTLLTMFLMFIGGGSNSTASGIKVSTFMVVILATRTFLKGAAQPVAFRRAVAMGAVFRAYTVVVLSLLLVMLACFLLVILQPQMRPMDLLFEGFSAFGTVGLSRGITADLSMPGQAVLMVLMFAGRIGPLALAFSLARPHRGKVRYSEDQVQIG
ncbi:TrkH family potassium uptake protein [Alloalcanivorax mobilis]|uniref:TrkH family potassium uptake protein n=1 Tax=Alloalcanivorax mobilis TaxID=2019569 RepID=UPI000C77505C|nr:TrkH family potassium uptake protein [Alloalcanivorax mobilis]